MQKLHDDSHTFTYATAIQLLCHFCAFTRMSYLLHVGA